MVIVSEAVMNFRLSSSTISAGPHDLLTKKSGLTILIEVVIFYLRHILCITELISERNRNKFVIGKVIYLVTYL